MGATTSPTTDTVDTVDSAATADTAGTDLLAVFESETDTITNAVATGRATRQDVEEFVRQVERGEVDAGTAADSVLRIVDALLRDETPSWVELEPAGQ